MAYTIGIVHCYFGPLPNYFKLWLLSVAYNPSIDFLLYTDQDLSHKPDNLRYFKTTLQQVEKLAQIKTGFHTLRIGRPYKLCDYKPMYGEIFQDDLSSYDFWGYCDSDLLLGDLRAFFTTETLNKYDKLLPLGHLSLYKNNPLVNSRWRLEGGRFPLQDVISQPENFAFDEWYGIYSIYEHHKFSFDKRVTNLGVIYALNSRFQLVSRSSDKYAKTSPDYPHQLFYWEEGKVLRAYWQDKKVKTDEFIYIHFFKRSFPSPELSKISKCKRIFCTPKRFILSDAIEPISLKQIKALNPYYGAWFEKIERKLRKKQGWLMKKLGLKKGLVKPPKRASVIARNIF